MTDPAPETVTTKSKVKMTAAIILAITLALFAAIALQVDDWGRDWTQNFAALEPDATRPELRPLDFQMTADEVADLVKLFSEKHSNWTWVTTQRFDPPNSSPPMNPETSIALKLTRQSSLMKFTDDVNVMLRINDDGSVTMTATSQSRLGKGDLGQNPRNLVELVSFVKNKAL